MEVASFVPYGPDHLAVLAVLGLGTLLLLACGGRLKRRDAPGVRRTLAVLLLGHGLYSWSLLWARGIAYVPLQVCDVTLVLAAAALWSPAPLVSELVYYWGLTGSLQALLTPALEDPFPTRGWFAFFVDHLGIVLSAVYVAVSGRVRPSASAAARAWLALNLYAGAAGVINWLAGTNYGFLAHKPAQPSLLDAFGPWPSYVVWMELAVVASFAVCYAPLAWSSRRETRCPS